MNIRRFHIVRGASLWSAGAPSRIAEQEAECIYVGRCFLGSKAGSPVCWYERDAIETFAKIADAHAFKKASNPSDDYMVCHVEEMFDAEGKGWKPEHERTGEGCGTEAAEPGSGDENGPGCCGQCGCAAGG